MITLVSHATTLAVEAHQQQLYAGRPYEFHLWQVVNNLITTVPWSALTQDLIDAAWLHDTLEDTRLAAHQLTPRTAEIVRAVTNVAGQPDYETIQRVPNAVLIKLADRVANVDFSFTHPDSGYYRDKYARQHEEFTTQLEGVARVDPELEEPVARLWHRYHTRIKEIEPGD